LPNTIAYTSSNRSTKENSIPFFWSGLSSRTSRSFSFGSTMRLMRMRRAAMTFSRTPPIGSTSPTRVSSPVIARSDGKRAFLNIEISAHAIAMPAEGPSFGIAPAGKWTW
jgi:hypothetical protein